MFFGLEQEDGSLIILYIPLEAGRGISTKTCWLDDVFPLDDISFGSYTQLIISK